MRDSRLIAGKAALFAFMCFLIGVIGGGLGSIKYFQENQRYLLPAFLLILAAVVTSCVIVGLIIRNDVMAIARKKDG
jgi:hypothetical protein